MHSERQRWETGRLVHVHPPPEASLPQKLGRGTEHTLPAKHLTAPWQGSIESGGSNKNVRGEKGMWTAGLECTEIFRATERRCWGSSAMAG